MIKYLIALVLLTWVAAAHGHGGGATPLPNDGADRHGKSAEKMALEEYHKGKTLIDDARLIEQTAEQTASEKRQARGFKKAQKKYRQAIGKFTRALKKEPLLYQAHAGLGQALSKTGDDRSAIHSYNRALELKPRKAEVMALRAVTLLNLGRLKDVQSTYTYLMRQNPSQGRFLRSEMLRWQEKRATQDSVSTDMSVQAFDQWLVAQPG